jgi:hypothetical protein
MIHNKHKGILAQALDQPIPKFFSLVPEHFSISDDKVHTSLMKTGFRPFYGSFKKEYNGVPILVFHDEQTWLIRIHQNTLHFDSSEAFEKALELIKNEIDNPKP